MTTQSSIWTIGQLLGWTTQYLHERGSESPRLDAEVLLAHARQCSRLDLYLNYDEVIDDRAREQYRSLIRRRAEGMPVAYLVGHKEFFSLELEVSPAVLIPRPESEFVVMEFLSLARDWPAPQVADVGTGSGNIAVAAAKHHSSARFIAIDTSPEALDVARRNALSHQVADRIRFIHGDLLSDLPAESHFDFILSNPPYIPSEQLNSLPVGVRDYEPRPALDGGEGGTELVQRLVAQAARHLHPGGYLILEIGAPQEKAIRDIIAETSDFEPPITRHDYSGHPRVIRCRRRTG